MNEVGERALGSSRWRRLTARSGSLVAAILTIALAPLPAHPQATLGGEWRGEVERLAQLLVDAQLVPGMGIAVTQGDRVVYSGGVGFADVGSGPHGGGAAP